MEIAIELCRKLRIWTTDLFIGLLLVYIIVLHRLHWTSDSRYPSACGTPLHHHFDYTSLYIHISCPMCFRSTRNVSIRLIQNVSGHSFAIYVYKFSCPLPIARICIRNSIIILNSSFKHITKGNGRLIILWKWSIVKWVNAIESICMTLLRK